MCALRVPVQGKVIRIGVLQDGKIVQERRLSPGETLTVGNDRRATVRCPLPSLPRRYALIEAHRGRYRLRVPAGIDGKLSHEGQVLTLEQVRQRTPSSKGRWDLELDDKTRGSIRLGSITLLFQLVQAPPVALRELERPSFRPRLLNDDDPVFMGFLGLFTVMASCFVAYTSTVQTPELLASIEQVPRFAELILAPKDVSEPDPIVPDPVVDDGPRQRVKDEPEPEPGPGTAVAKNDAPPERPLTAQEAAYREIQRKEDLRQEVIANSRVLQLLASRGISDAGFLDPKGVWGDGVDIPSSDNLPDGSVNLVVYTKRGIGSGTSREDAGIELTTLSGGDANITDAGGVGPEPTILEPTDALPKNSPDAEKVHRAIRAYYPRVKTCYERGLKENPGLQGRIEFEWVVDGGAALDIYVLSNSTGDRELEQCIADSIIGWNFPAEVVAFPVVFPFVLAPG